jgi:hypothetical protein
MLKMGMALCAGVLFTQLAWAQPDPNVAPKADNPPENARGNRGHRLDRQKQMEDRMRQMLAHVGVNDAPTQDAVIAFVQADTEARRPLREQTMKLFQALNNGGVTDDQIQALVTDLRAAQEADKARREKAQADLDAQIHYKQTPRLEAVLLLAGIIGDGQNATMFLGGGRGGNPGGGNQRGDLQQRREQLQQRMLQRFDKNNNGKLDADEEAAMQQWRQERRQNRDKDKAGANDNNDDNDNAGGAVAAPAGDVMPNA